MVREQLNHKCSNLKSHYLIGGRVVQDKNFIPAIRVKLGAKILHGTGTELTKFAIETDQKLEKIFVGLMEIVDQTSRRKMVVMVSTF